MKIRYIGSFPPPYGGVTKKNQLLFEELSNYVDVIKNTSNNKLIRELSNVLYAIFGHNPLVIGVSATRGKSTVITSLLFYFNKNIIRNSLYFMMGGLEANSISKSNFKIKVYSGYKKIYVESIEMKKKLNNVGMNNVEVYPNCRRRYDEIIPVKNETECLKCVFFSNIMKIKGVDIIIDVAKKMQQVEFHLYGFVQESYRDEFSKQIHGIDNIFYEGIFNGNDSSVIDELRKYDVLLFPTRYKEEGFPGVLIEGKIAGLAEIVTDICYNKELVQDEVDGIVIECDSQKALFEAIMQYDSNRERLYLAKLNSLKSARRYDIKNYIEKIVEELGIK